MALVKLLWKVILVDKVEAKVAWNGLDKEEFINDVKEFLKRIDGTSESALKLLSELSDDTKKILFDMSNEDFNNLVYREKEKWAPKE